MKAHSTIVMFAAVLLAAGRLAAHNPPDKTPHIPAHEHPLYTSVVTTFEFDDGTIVEWRPVPGLEDHYTVKITQVRPAAGAVKVYSMLTLGLQSIRDDNEATLTTGADVMVYTHNVAAGAAWNVAQTQTLSKTGLGASGRLDADKIKFISFSDRQCELRVTAIRRPKFGDSRWDGFPGNKSGHDNTPPGGYPPN